MTGLTELGVPHCDGVLEYAAGLRITPDSLANSEPEPHVPEDWGSRRVTEGQERRNSGGIEILRGEIQYGPNIYMDAPTPIDNIALMNEREHLRVDIFSHLLNFIDDSTT